jgi:hypothetical protein
LVLLLFLILAATWREVNTLGYVHKNNKENIIYITTDKKVLTIEIQNKKTKGSLQWND